MRKGDFGLAPAAPIEQPAGSNGAVLCRACAVGSNPSCHGTLGVQGPHSPGRRRRRFHEEPW